ncbi:MAG: tRNA pseudouridine(38-40) synthase TruA [Gemmatimonadales bacterium]|nr:MAG: tRNA pseudouridine(38-40) synthase TruA [Gemmatimonadales bacterium]
MSDLTRFALRIHYDGSAFHGWQLQARERTVQGEVEAVLRRITGARRPVVGSGRTDRGVHAHGQIASVDIPAGRWTAETLRKSLNALLPRDVWIERVWRVSATFHPRFDARRRTYLYRLGLEHRAGSPFYRGWCWDVSAERPSLDLLREGAALIPGHRSFRRFAKAGQPERGERCRVQAAAWEAWDGPGIQFRVTADRYLHHMVRYLVGTLMEVGRERRPLGDLAELLHNPDTPLRTSPPAPPEGLFLHRVEYERDLFLDADDRDPSGPGSESCSGPPLRETRPDQPNVPENE